MSDSSKAGWKKESVTYCSNVHPGQDYAQALAQIDAHFVPIKKSRNLSSMSLGLWFNENLIDALLSDSAKAERYCQALQKNRFKIITLNAFPQKHFHHDKVKSLVYLPDWSEQARETYTLKLLQFIQAYPDIFHKNISISTVPLGYGENWNKRKQEQATARLKTVASACEQLYSASQIHVRLCLEMEPDCALEYSSQMIQFFKEDLQIHRDKLVAEHLGVCFDICHQAVMHEDIQRVLREFESNEIVIGKIQVSSALSFQADERKQNISDLNNFLDSPYLHQLKTRAANNHPDTGENQLTSIPDISQSTLSDSSLAVQNPWLIHFHLPIHIKNLGSIHLNTTQSAIISTLDFLKSSTLRPHLEVETYTWGVLNKNDTVEDLNDNLLNELTWLENELEKRSLLHP